MESFDDKLTENMNNNVSEPYNFPLQKREWLQIYNFKIMI